MTPINFRFDGTVNLSMLGGLIVIIATAAYLYGGLAKGQEDITARLRDIEGTQGQVVQLLTAENSNRRDIDAIREEIRDLRGARQ